jgi:hypothetical protein
MSLPLSLRCALAGGMMTALLGAPCGMALGEATAAGQGPTVPEAPSSAAGTPGVTAPGVTAPDSAAPAPAEDIRDIRGPKFVASPWLIPAILAALALLAWGAYGVWRWYHRRKIPRVLLPYEVALERLEAIRVLMQPAKAREFSIAASDIVRGYIEERFSVTATHRTTEEFLHDLLESPNASLARHRGLLSEFLNQCDLVKFAGVSLSTHTMETLHESARAFVLETAKPDPVPEINQPVPELTTS